MEIARFDTLRFSRGLREVGFPEHQADRQAELMAEAFTLFADNLVTKDYFSEVLNARLREQSAELKAHVAQMEQRLSEKLMAHVSERLAEQDAKFDKRFDEQDAKFDKRFDKQEAKFEERFARIEAHLANHDARFAKLDRTMLLHTWMLGLIMVALVVPELQRFVA